MTAPAYRVGADIGGTFTDIVVLGGNGRVFTRKVSSSAGDYSRAIVDGLRAIQAETGLPAPTSPKSGTAPRWRPTRFSSS